MTVLTEGLIRCQWEPFVVLSPHWLELYWQTAWSAEWTVTAGML